MVISASKPLVLMYGGTFDPIHFGHLRSALELTQVLSVARVHMMPCQLPPHRPAPHATALQRLTMLKLALKGETTLVADDRELRRAGPSYSLDTLQSLRADYGPDQPLALVIGQDAFLGLLRWSRYEQLLDWAHLIVIARPGEASVLSPALAKWLMPYETLSASQLNRQASGCVARLTLPSQLHISATFIRQTYFQRQSVRYLLPESVQAYIEQQQLYQVP